MLSTVFGIPLILLSVIIQVIIARSLDSKSGPWGLRCRLCHSGSDESFC